VPAQPQLAGRGDIADADLLEQDLASLVGRVQRPQRLLVGASRGGIVPDRVVRAAEREGREGEPRVGVQRPAEGRGRTVRLARLEHHQPVNELRVRVQGIIPQQRLHLRNGPVTVALARRDKHGSEPLIRWLARWHRLTGARDVGMTAAGPKGSWESWGR